MSSNDEFKVGVYVDGFNLYYGGRSIFGKGTQGWKWLDLRKLSRRLLEHQGNWPPATEIRIVYCTARVSGTFDQQKSLDQDVYLRAISSTKSVDHIEFGYYSEQIYRLPLAVLGSGKRKRLVSSNWPVMVQDKNAESIEDANFIVSVLKREEKGSDVNLACHLLREGLTERIDAAMIISNDSDLRLPIYKMSQKIPIGLVNPGMRPTAGALNMLCMDENRHWKYGLQKNDFLLSQLNVSEKYKKPFGW